MTRIILSLYDYFNSHRLRLWLLLTAVLAGLLTQDRSDNRRFSRRVGKLPNTSGMFTVSLLLKPGKLRYFNYNQYVYKQANVWTYPQEPGVNGVMISCRVPDEGEEYARQIDLLTPMSWSEVAPWADQPDGRRDKAYQDMKHQKALACIALAERALPGLSEITQKVFSSTPLTYRHFNLTPQGSAFGIRKDCRQPLLTYFSPRTQSANLLLTGQSLMLHGIEGVTLTALSSCAAIIGEKAIQDIVNQQ